MIQNVSETSSFALYFCSRKSTALSLIVFGSCQELCRYLLHLTLQFVRAISSSNIWRKEKNISLLFSLATNLLFTQINIYLLGEFWPYFLQFSPDFSKNLTTEFHSSAQLGSDPIQHGGGQVT